MNRRIFLKLFCFFLCMQQQSIGAFSSLSDITRYAASLPEYVTPSNKNWLYPDFSAFYVSRKPSWMRKVAEFFGWRRTDFSIAFFKKMLRKVNSFSKKKSKLKNNAIQIQPDKGNRFIVWTDLFGAFHSLVRDLNYLHQQGVLNDKLKIIKPGYYFVFNGNLIDGSPYILETLTLVLQLMASNRQQVLYTRGYQETRERWHNYGLSKELQMRVSGFVAGSIPFSAELDRFFSSLPIALFITQKQKKEIQTVVISSNENTAHLIKQQDISFALSTDKKYSQFSMNPSLHLDEQKTANPVKIRAYITNEDRSVSYIKHTGMASSGTFAGATRWIEFSSPTERNQSLYNFYYDAFVELAITNGFDTWTLSLINQKVPDMNGFQVAATFNLVTGRKLSDDGQGMSQNIYNFGATMDLSRSASPVGKKVKEGLELAFDRELTIGALKGFTPQIVTIDDEYTPIKTRQAVQQLMANGIEVFVGSQGTPTLNSYLDLIKQGELLVLFPFTGSPLFRMPDLKNVIHYRGSYIQEGKELIKYALNDLKAKKIAIFYQDDAFGRGALQGAREALKEAGITDFIEVPHESTVIDYAPQAEKIKNANPDTILFSTNSLDVRGLIRQLGVQYFAGKNLLGISVFEDAFERFSKDKGLTFILTRVIPDPATSKLQIAQEYREWADKKNVSYDKVSFEQYINANILFYILQKIEGPITANKIITIAEQFKDESFKGLVLNFNPQTRELSDTLWIDAGKVPWIERQVKVEPIAEKETSLPLSEVKDTGTLQYGSTIDLSKGAQLLGKAVQEGIELRLAQAKKEGIKNIPSIKIVDDAYTPTQTRTIIEQFIKQGIHMVVCPTGSANLEAYLDLVNDGRMTVLFPITGAPQFRKKSLSNIVHLRASYASESRILTQYALDELQAKKLVLFYQNDAFGKSFLDPAKNLLEKRKNSSVLDVPYNRNATDFAVQVEKIKQFNPDAILFFSTTIAAQKLLEAIGADTVKEKHLLGNSDFGEKAFQAYIKEKGISFMTVNVVPNPHTSQLQIVKEYRKAIPQDGMLDSFSLESYIGVDLLLHILQEIEPPASRNNIIKKLTMLNGVQYKGLYLTFDSQTRTLLHTVWLSKDESDWKEINLSTDSKTN